MIHISDNVPHVVKFYEQKVPDYIFEENNIKN